MERTNAAIRGLYFPGRCDYPSYSAKRKVSSVEVRRDEGHTVDDRQLLLTAELEELESLSSCTRDRVIVLLFAEQLSPTSRNKLNI